MKGHELQHNSLFCFNGVFVVEVKWQDCCRTDSGSSCLQDVADSATVAVQTALQFLPNFPRGEHLPQPVRCEQDGTFVYDKNAWLEAAQKSGTTSVGGVKRKWPGQPEADRLKFCNAEGMHLRSLSRAADEYLLRVHRLRGFAADVGAGGDCFFLSVAQSLQSLRKQVEKLPAPVDELFALTPCRKEVAKRLRAIVGQGVTAWAPHRFVDFVTTCLGDEVAGTWLDRWKMSSVIAATPFAFLQTVNAVEQVQVVDSNNLGLRCKHGDSNVPVVHTISEGLDALSTVQRIVAKHLSEPGNNHWATQVDVDILAHELQISFCILGNEPVSTKPAEGEVVPSVLHAYACAVEDVSLWVTLYNISNQHFQALFLDLENGFQSSFLSTEMPASLASALRNRRTM